MRCWSVMRAASGLLCCAGLLLSSGCAEVEDLTSLKQEVESFEQKLVLEVAGKPVEIPLEKLDIFLTEDEEYPEIFEMHGSGVVLVGTFPADVRVDYGDHWDRLVEKPIPISDEGGDPRDLKKSHVTLPGQAKLTVTGGTFTVEKFSDSYDAKTPLTGRIELKVETPAGEQTYKGTFTVKGTTWG